EHQVLGDRHVWSCTAEGILEDPPNEGGAAMFGPARYVVTLQTNRAGIQQESPSHGVEQGGLARAVGADDDDKRPFVNCQVHALQGANFVGSARVKCFPNAADLKHDRLTPCFFSSSLKD